jgi:parallel beta-helix repeat protein
VREGTEIAGRYVLETPLGHGGMGEVWRASDRQLRRLVAVKVMRERVADTRRFEREARIAARLQHPGITVVHDFGTHDGSPYMVMELLRGHDLAFELTQSPAGLPSDRVIPLAIQAAEALQAAHENQVIHRDLKPANLFLQSNGQLKICDFGIARTTDTSEVLITSPGYAIGTVAYMSPEQCEGKPADQRSDLYSLGCVLYALLTGQPPFPVGEQVVIMDHQRHTPPEALRARRPDIPADLDRLVLNLLAKAPDQRPADAGQVIAALKGSAPSPAAKAQTEVTVPGGPARVHTVDARLRGDFTTIAAAIRAAWPGDRILVRPGLYEGGLILDKGLEIIGDGLASDIEIRAYGTETLVFEARNAEGRVANLTLRQVRGGREYHAVDVRQGRLDLGGCNIRSGSSTCVAVMAGASLRLHDSTIHGSPKSGVLICESGVATLEDNEITGNQASGVQVRTGASATLRGNRIHHNTESGIWVYDDGQATLEDNDITSNGLAGVSVRTGGRVTARGNRINRNTDVAVWVRDGGHAEVEDNDLRGNAGGPWKIGPGSRPNVQSARNKVLAEELPQVAELPLDMRPGHLVPGERVHRDVLSRGDLVVRGEHRGRRADHVHQAHRQQAAGGDPAGQQRAVHVPQRVQRGRDQVHLVSQELGDLGIGRVRGQGDGPLDVAQERHVGVAHRDQLRDQRGGGQRQPAALAHPGHRHARGAGQLAGCLDRPYRVGEQAGVIVVLGSRDAPGHHARVFRARVPPVRVIAGRTGAPPPALAPGVHHQQGVAERGQQHVFGRTVAPAAVADELHHHPGFGSGRGPQVPRPDPVAARSGELGVVDLERCVRVGLVAGQGRLGRRGASLVQVPLPP